MSKINSDDIKEYFISCGKLVTELIRDSYEDIINQEVKEAFSDAIEIGIINTIVCLHDANVDEDDIVGVLNKFWGINRKEALDRLLHEKSESTIRVLKHFLKMEGHNSKQIKEFIKSNNTAIIMSYGN